MCIRFEIKVKVKATVKGSGKEYIKDFFMLIQKKPSYLIQEFELNDLIIVHHALSNIRRMVII